MDENEARTEWDNIILKLRGMVVSMQDLIEDIENCRWWQSFEKRITVQESETKVEDSGPKDEPVTNDQTWGAKTGFTQGMKAYWAGASDREAAAIDEITRQKGE